MLENQKQEAKQANLMCGYQWNQPEFELNCIELIIGNTSKNFF